MSDKRFCATPVIVGVVIALLGILTGLYIADNARRQLAAVLAASEETAGAASIEEAAGQPAASDDQGYADMEELPPLEPVVEVAYDAPEELAAAVLPDSAREAEDDATPPETADAPEPGFEQDAESGESLPEAGDKEEPVAGQDGEDGETP